MWKRCTLTWRKIRNKDKKAKIMEKREILFRGWNKKNKKWLYGYYLVNRGEHFISPDVLKDLSTPLDEYLVDADSVGQYTGMKDAKGVKIFEGDIVIIGNNLKAIVIWFNGSFRFQDELSSKATYFEDIGAIMRDYDVQVIGNIHEDKN